MNTHLVKMSNKIVIGGIALLAVLMIAAAPVSAEQIVGNQIGWLTFHTNVDGATIYINGNPAGTTVNQEYTYTVYLDGSPSSMPSTAYAAKSGYDNSQVVSVSIPSAGETNNYYMTLNPLTPSTGTIYAQSSPTNAQVYIDGTYYGLTPHSITGLSVGSHSVLIQKSGYQDWSSTAQVNAGGTTNVYATLSAVQTYGAISVRSTPSGASVYLDGNYQGTTPMTISGVVKGAHMVELQKSGYYEWSGQVTVYAGQTTSVSQVLNQIPNPTTGTISVSSTPGGAYIYLDGAYEGVTPYSGSYIIHNVGSGSHTITLKLSGYQDSTVPVTVQGGGIATVTVPLNPTTPVTGTGVLDISSNPTGANVYINNEYKGIAPLQVTLPAGDYSITFKLTGYTDSTVTATVNSGGTSTVQGSLVPASQPTQSGIPAISIIVAGIIGAAAFVLIGRRE